MDVFVSVIYQTKKFSVALSNDASVAVDIDSFSSFFYVENGIQGNQYPAPQKVAGRFYIFGILIMVFHNI